MQPFTFFVSYRREDTAPIALLLKSEIEKRLRFVRVAVDVEEMWAGDHFPDRLHRLIDHAHATIALIGKHWMPKPGAGRGSRVGDDWVVRELAYSFSTPLRQAESDRYGLQRREIIPLFVDCERGFGQFKVPKDLAFLIDLHAERIDYAGWPKAVGPLIDGIADRLNLENRPSKDEIPQPDLAKAKAQALGDAELASILAYHDYEGWYIDNFGHAEARYLAKTFKFRGFNQAADFMELVSTHCRVLDHHPEWRNVFNQVSVALTTWDARRKVTIYDLSLALYMNMAENAVKKKP